jgi:hypothetical protein
MSLAQKLDWIYNEELNAYGADAEAVADVGVPERFLARGLLQALKFGEKRDGQPYVTENSIAQAARDVFRFGQQRLAELQQVPFAR